MNAMITQSASAGDTVSATRAVGIIAISGQKFGMKLRAHATRPKSNA